MPLVPSKKQIDSNLRTKMLEEMKTVYEDLGYTVLQVKGNKLAIACVDELQDDRWCEVTIAIPTGARDDDEGYDAEVLMQDYQDHLAEVAANKKQRDEQRKAEFAAAQAKRQAKAEAKAKTEAEKKAKAQTKATEQKQE